MTRILVTTDGSDLGHLALAHAQALAGALHADLTVLQIQLDAGVPMAGEYGYLPPTEPTDMARQKAQIDADLRVRAPDARVRIELAGGRAVTAAITDVARDEGVDLIVMSTHGRSGLGRVLLGSVAEGVTHGAPVPVMLVRAGQTPAQWVGVPLAASVQSPEGLQG